MRLPRPLQQPYERLRTRHQVWLLLEPLHQRKRRPLRQLHYTLELNGVESAVYQGLDEAIAAAESQRGRYQLIEVWCYDEQGTRMWANLTFSRGQVMEEPEPAPVRPRRRSRISPLAERVAERAAPA